MTSKPSLPGLFGGRGHKFYRFTTKLDVNRSKIDVELKNDNDITYFEIVFAKI